MSRLVRKTSLSKERATGLGAIKSILLEVPDYVAPGAKKTRSSKDVTGVGAGYGALDGGRWGLRPLLGRGADAGRGLELLPRVPRPDAPRLSRWDPGPARAR